MKIKKARIPAGVYVEHQTRNEVREAQAQMTLVEREGVHFIRFQGPAGIVLTPISQVVSLEIVEEEPAAPDAKRASK